MIAVNIFAFGGTVNEPQFKFVLLEKEETTQHGPPVDGPSNNYYSTPPSKDRKKDEELLKEIEQRAAANNLQKNTETKHDSGMLVSDGNKQFYGGSVSFTEILNIITYTGVAAGGFATFVNNILSAAVNWRNLRQNRSFHIDVQGTPIDISDGATALQVMEKINDVLMGNHPKRHP